MTLRPLNSKTARTGLLALAVLHMVAVAMLPFTHRHLLPTVADAASAVASAPGGQAEGPGDPANLPHDESSCVVCRTLAGAHVATAPAPTFAGGTERSLIQPAAEPDAPRSYHSGSTRSRAPPRI